MSNQLASDVKTSVVVTRLGDFWVTEKVARSIASGMNDKNAHAVLEDVGVISMSQVFGVLTSKGYDAYQHKQKGEWQCPKGEWHGKFESCDCPVHMEDMKLKTDEIDKLLEKL